MILRQTIMHSDLRTQVEPIFDHSTDASISEDQEKDMSGRRIALRTSLYPHPSIQGRLALENQLAIGQDPQRPVLKSSETTWKLCPNGQPIRAAIRGGLIQA
jgi:hypothetical protein